MTAAAAIAALQEAGNKASRDMIAASYRAYTQINTLCVELIRQFYDVSRSFRITGEGNEYQFVTFDNSGLQDQVTGLDTLGNEMYRRPVFDLKIKAQKKNPFSRMEQNERAKELYSLGFFAPENAQASLIALEMMDFEGIQMVREKVMQGQTLLNMVMQMQQQLTMITGALMPQEETRQTGGNNTGGGEAEAHSELASGIMEAQTPMTGYGQALAKRSVPSV